MPKLKVEKRIQLLFLNTQKTFKFISKAASGARVYNINKAVVIYHCLTSRLISPHLPKYSEQSSANVHPL